MVVLSGRALRLREFERGDEAPFVAMADDVAMFEYMKFRFADRADALRHFEWLVHADRRVEPRSLFYLVLDIDGSFAGYAGLGRSSEGEAEFGWYLPSAFWNRGLATEATSLLVRWAFDELGYERLIATCDPENAASRRVLEKAGMLLEGELPEPVKTWRGPRPRLLFSLTRA